MIERIHRWIIAHRPLGDRLFRLQTARFSIWFAPIPRFGLVNTSAAYGFDLWRFYFRIHKARGV